MTLQINRQGQSRWILIIYFSTSFISLFTLNYIVQSRAYHQLLDLKNRSDGAKYGLIHSVEARHTITVPIFHEKYEVFSTPCLLWEISILLSLALILGIWVWGTAKYGKKRYLIFALAVYLITPIIANFLIYHDMMGIILISFVYVTLFFLIKGIQEFNPHFEAGLKFDDASFQSLFQLYQRYFIVSLAVLGFVAATFMASASSILKDVYQRTDGPAADTYRAILMPYLQGIYGFAAIGCIALGVGFARECHVKLHDLLRVRASTQSPHSATFE